MTEAAEPTDASFEELLTFLSHEFEVVCAERHDKGAEKYGPAKFLLVDTIEEALQEVADLANYARYTYIRLRLLQEAVEQNTPPDSTEPPLKFVKARDITKLRRKL
jgi:hypothetical protein